MCILKSISSFIDASKRSYGFIDERGNFGFDFEKQGVSSHFIITAIIIDEKMVDSLEQDVEKIRKKFFQIGEMKSSNVGSNSQRRMLILKEMQNLNFKIFSVVVDKRKILQTSGLAYKKTFIKYLNGLLYDELHNYFPKLQLIADEHGSKEFMDGFRNYMLKEHIPNFFGDYEFGFGNSKSEILIQLADFICGTIAFGYEDGLNEVEFKDYACILKEKLLPITFWPQDLDDYIKRLEEYKNDVFDENIAYTSIKLARKFVDKNIDKKMIEIQEQIYVLKYLLSMLISQNSNKYISTKEIINNLHEITGRDYTPHYFKTRIIAKLRDAGVLISSSQNGYKIPIREKEILEFVNQTSSMIKPMIARLRICRDRVLSATQNEFDVLEFKEYEYLKLFYNDRKGDKIQLMDDDKIIHGD